MQTCPRSQKIKLDKTSYFNCDNNNCHVCYNNFKEQLRRCYESNELTNFKQIFQSYNKGDPFAKDQAVILLKTVEFGNVPFVDYLLKQKVDVIYKLPGLQLNDTYPVWFTAIEKNNLEMIKLFQKHGADFKTIGKLCSKSQVHGTGKLYGNALHKAAMYGSTDILKFLCHAKKMRSIINQPAFDQYQDQTSIVSMAVYSKTSDVELLQCLIDLGAKFDNCNMHNENVLHITAFNYHTKSLAFLVDALPKELLFQRDNAGKIPLEACQIDSTEERRILTEAMEKARDAMAKELLQAEEKQALKLKNAKEKQERKLQAQKDKKLQKLLYTDVKTIQQEDQKISIDPIFVFLNEESCQDQIQEFMQIAPEEQSCSQKQSKLMSEGLSQLNKEFEKNKFEESKELNFDAESNFDPQRILEESKSEFQAFDQSELGDLDDLDFQYEQSINTNVTNQSFMSMMTVHSRNLKQKMNEHWQTRANERGGLDVTDPDFKQALLKELKEELKLGDGNVRHSIHDPNKVCITAKDSGLHFILAKQKVKMHKKNFNKNSVSWTVSEKQVYVPVTVLAPGMMFE